MGECPSCDSELKVAQYAAAMGSSLLVGQARACPGSG